MSQRFPELWSRLAQLLLTFLILIWATAGQAEGKRVALVVGAGAYQQVPKLVNPVNDANGISAALQHLGFEVQLVLDPDRFEFEKAIRAFGQSARNSDVALFFYSGHGFQVNGRNWLVPVSAKLESQRDLRFEALDLDLITEQTEGAARATLIILDACRDNPFERKWSSASRGNEPRGLARTEAATGGLIVYSTAPGRVALDGTGKNSPFTAALLKHIETPQLEIRQMLTLVRRDVQSATNGSQVPYDTSSLEGDFYFKPADQQTSAPAATPAQDMGVSLEALFWQSVKDGRNPDEYRAYLKRYPNGIFADLATSRLQSALTEAERRVASAPVVPPQAPPAPVPEPQVPPSPDLLKTPLAESLARQIPAAPPSFRAARVDAFNKSRTNKAMAVAAPDSVWTTAGLPSAAAAEASALEKCQVYFRRTCSVVAINDTIVPNPVMRDMPRVRWRGHLDPDQVPGLLPETRPTASDWQNYLNNTGFKAIAYHPWGKVVMKTSTTSQKQAEEQALTECNADPQRNGRDGPCYLYAIRNSVVLTSYFIEPHRPVTTLDDLLSLLQVPTDYKSEKNNKAIAYAFNRRGSYRVSNRPDQDIAAEAALEGCQLMYKEPCVLIAQNDRVLADGDPFQGTPRRTVSLDYSGKFSRDQIPKLFRAKLTEIASYEAMKGPRAMAVRPVNSLLTVSGGATQKEAEQQALDSCNKDMSPYPYFLYAAQDQVVIARRLTEPR